MAVGSNGDKSHSKSGPEAASSLSFEAHVSAKPEVGHMPTSFVSSEVRLADRLLNAATEVFLEKGFSAATVDEIASRAKAGKITFYNHFGNKEALFEAIVLRLNGRLFEGFIAALETDAPVEEALTLFLQQLAQVVHTKERVRLVRVLHAEVERFPRLAEIFDQAGPRKAHALLEKFFLQKMKAGELRHANAAIAAEQLVQMAIGEQSRRVLLGLTKTSSRRENESRIAPAVDTFMRAYGVKS